MTSFWKVTSQEASYSFHITPSMTATTQVSAARNAHAPFNTERILVRVVGPDSKKPSAACMPGNRAHISCLILLYGVSKGSSTFKLLHVREFCKDSTIPCNPKFTPASIPASRSDHIEPRVLAASKENPACNTAPSFLR